MAWWQTLLVALGSSALGGGLTAWATLHAFKRQERAAVARELRAQLGAFAGAVIVAVAYIREIPPNAPDLMWVKKKAPEGLRRWYVANTWVNQQRRLRKVLGDRPFLNVERVVLAAAPLRVLPLPSPLREVINDTLTYVEDLSAERSDELKGKWPEIHRRFFEVLQASVADADEVLRALGKPPLSSA